MRIEESNVHLTSQHEAKRTHTLEVTGTQSFRQTLTRLTKPTGNDEAACQQRLQKMLQSLVEAIMAAINGKRYQEKVAASEVLPPEGETASSPEREITWQRSITECISEFEHTSVCGSGKVKTSDGRAIDFNYNVALERDYQSRKTLDESGSVKLRDPLILSFEGKSCELTEEYLSFDLNADGSLEKIPGLGPCSGFLVLDRNSNGKADDGNELFGVASGDGFADLSQYDSDHNGWIDEADPVWQQLAVWSGDSFSSLTERGVGALHLGAVEAPFALKTAANQLLGQIRSAGLYLSESGEVGQLQQVDLAVLEKES